MTKSESKREINTQIMQLSNILKFQLKGNLNRQVQTLADVDPMLNCELFTDSFFVFRKVDKELIK